MLDDFKDDAHDETCDLLGVPYSTNLDWEGQAEWKPGGTSVNVFKAWPVEGSYYEDWRPTND